MPVRVLEWSWVIGYFFDRGRDFVGVALDVVWSLVLDLPVLLGAAWFAASIG